MVLMIGLIAHQEALRDPDARRPEWWQSHRYTGRLSSRTSSKQGNLLLPTRTYRESTIFPPQHIGTVTER